MGIRSSDNCKNEAMIEGKIWTQNEPLRLQTKLSHALACVHVQTLKRGGRQRKSFNRKERPIIVAMLQC